jgi:hypothetical protein
VDVVVSPDERDRRGQRSRVVLAPLGWCQVCELMISQTTVTKKVMDTGEITYKPQNHRAGNAG